MVSQSNEQFFNSFSDSELKKLLESRTPQQLNIIHSSSGNLQITSQSNSEDIPSQGISVYKHSSISDFWRLGFEESNKYGKSNKIKQKIVYGGAAFCEADTEILHKTIDNAAQLLKLNQSKIFQAFQRFAQKTEEIAQEYSQITNFRHDNLLHLGILGIFCDPENPEAFSYLCHIIPVLRSGLQLNPLQFISYIIQNRHIKEYRILLKNIQKEITKK